MSDLAEPYVLGPGEGRWKMEQAGAEIGFLARSADTGGSLTFLSYEVPAGFTGPPLHVHRDLDEGMLILEGRFAIRIGDEEHELGPGQFAWLPRNVPHAFANVGDTRGKWVGFATPPGQMEEFFAAIQKEMEGSDGPPDPERLMELNERHGIEVLGPPIRTPAAG